MPAPARLIAVTERIIIVNVLLMHIPTAALTFGSNGSINPSASAHAYNVMEKIQMTVFAATETFLSSVFIFEAVRLLRTSLQPATRKVMEQLFAINLVIILMDNGLLALEYASLYVLETLLKGPVYSIKSRLEFVILGKLVKFLRGTKPGADAQQSSFGFVTKHGTISVDTTMDVPNFVNLNRVTTDVVHPPPSYGSGSTISQRRKTSGQALDYDIARFEHIEDVASLQASLSTLSLEDDQRPLRSRTGPPNTFDYAHRPDFAV